MAEETQTKNTEQNTGEQAQQQGSKAPTKLVIIVIALAILVMILTPVVTIFALKTSLANDGNDAQKKEQKNPGGTQVVMPKIQTNIAGTQGQRYAQFEVILNVSNTKTAQLFREKPEKSDKSLLKLAQARIVSLATNKDLQTLLKQEGRNKLAQEIKDSLNELLMKKEKEGVVKTVLFSSFLIQ